MADLARWNLGAVLHRVSHLRWLFWALGLVFQARAMLAPGGAAVVEPLSATLLMYGIAMSFEGLRDAGRISEARRQSMRARPGPIRWTVAFVFAGGLFAIAVGCLLFFRLEDRELAWAVTTFGLGMVSLGRQQHDALGGALAEVPAATARAPVEPAPVQGPAEA